MPFEVIFRDIGDLGKFQIYMISVVSFTSLYAGFLFLNSFFVLGIPKHRYDFELYQGSR